MCVLFPGLLLGVGVYRWVSVQAHMEEEEDEVVMGLSCGPLSPSDRPHLPSLPN